LAELGTGAPSGAGAFCGNCGYPAEPDSRFCGVCGAPVTPVAASTQLVAQPQVPLSYAAPSRAVVLEPDSQLNAQQQALTRVVAAAAVAVVATGAAGAVLAWVAYTVASAANTQGVLLDLLDIAYAVPLLAGIGGGLVLAFVERRNGALPSGVSPMVSGVLGAALLVAVANNMTGPIPGGLSAGWVAMASVRNLGVLGWVAFCAIAALGGLAGWRASHTRRHVSLALLAATALGVSLTLPMIVRMVQLLSWAGVKL
jgi:hypothetical protein